MGLYWTAATLSCLVAGADAWNDIAGALTYKGTSHVFQVRCVLFSICLSDCLSRSPCRSLRTHTAILLWLLSCPVANSPIGHVRLLYVRRAAQEVGSLGHRRKDGTTLHPSE